MPVDIIDEIRPYTNQRATFREWVGYFLGVFSLVLLVVLATNAYGQEVKIPLHVYEDDGVTLHLFAGPCESEEAKAAINAFPPLKDLADKFRRADSTWLVQTPFGGVRAAFAGCWVPFTFRGKDGYAVAFEDGEIKFVPADALKKTKGMVGV
jgi:hypothetical protein